VVKGARKRGVGSYVPHENEGWMKEVSGGPVDDQSIEKGE